MKERPDPRDYSPGGKHWKPHPDNRACMECGTRDSDHVELMGLRTELSACRRVVEAAKAMHFEADKSRAYERSDHLADAMDTFKYALAALESQASALPKEEKPACPTCGGEGLEPRWLPGRYACPACTQAQGGE